MRQTNRFQIEIETSWSNPDYARAQGYLPFFFRARDLEERYASIAFGVQYHDVEIQYERLSKELGDALRKATIRWAIAKVEENILSGAVEFQLEPRRETQNIVLSGAELATIRRLIDEKTCEYQIRAGSGRDLFCSAASPHDRSIVARQGLQKLAPTSRPICKACTMPDTEYLCSHLTHPQVFEPAGSKHRQLMEAYCEIDQPEIKTHPSQCHAGGHKCWVRIVASKAEPAPSYPYSPRELPTALDFLNAIWERAFSRPLLRLRSVEKTAALSLTCANHDEFRSRLDDLNELFKLFDIPDDLLAAEKRQIEKRQTFNRMTACVEKRIADVTECERVLAGIDDLRAISNVRNKLSHGGSELSQALEYLNIEYPIRDYARAWDRVRAKGAEAFSTMRSVLQGVL